jgi:hypothetical protein
MIASRQSAANSIARTSLAFYIRDELRAAVRARRRNAFVRSHACRSGRDAGLAGSIVALVRVLLHRGETTWQQRRRRAAEGPKPNAAHRPARARARVRGKRRPAPRLARSGASSLGARANGKAGDIAGFFALSDLTSSNERSPAARSSRSARDTPSRLSARREQTRSSLPGSSWGWPRSRKLPLWR